MTASTNYNDTSYLDFFGLDHAPFPMAPDDTDFFFSDNTDDIIERVCKAIFARRGFILLTGDVGLGKTTLTRRIVARLEQTGVATCLILHSFYQEHDLLKAINKDFGLQVEGDCITSQMEALNEFLLEKYNQGINCTIIIDDAQGLSFESLELVRMLSNLEADQEKLVQIFLVGQTELALTMHRHGMRQLKSRVSLWMTPKALDRKGIENYVHFKLNKAGDQGRIKMDHGAVKRLYKLSGGNYRRINVIMDNTLQNAFAKSCLTIRKEFVQDVLTPKEAREKIAFAGPVILVLTIIALGWLAGSYFFYRTAIQPDSHQEIRATKLYPVIDDRPVSAQVAPAVEENTPAPETKKAQEPADPDQEKYLSRFLSFYKLEQARQPLMQFLNGKKDFQSTRTAIFQDFGYQLIRLKTLEPGLEKEFCILRSWQEDSSEKEYYLFWTPCLVFDNFAMDLQSRKVQTLQRMLTTAGDYTGRVNGVVKPELIKSLKKFQLVHQIYATGRPDPETLFLLTRETDSYKAGAM